MNIQNVNWKLFIENPEDIVPAEFFKVFSDWIPDSPEIFVDVSDYTHVHDGPILFLAGHFVNFALDLTGNRLGLLSDYKQVMDGSDEEILRKTLAETLQTAKRLEDEPQFKTAPKFSLTELSFIVNNRAVAPNTPATFAALAPELQKVLGKAFGSDKVHLEQVKGDPRERFAVTIQIQEDGKGKPSLANLISKLA